MIELQVENIKCGGCASSIRKGLLSDTRVKDVNVDVEQGKISIDVSANSSAADESIRNELAAALLKMGYPESGTAEGIRAAKAKAKSFVSCAIGRVDNMVNK
jgi:copper chaperone